MYAFIRGVVDEVGIDYAVLDVGGVGYMVYTNTAALSQMVRGEEARLYTVLSVREDSMTLFGFMTLREKQLYERLQTVTGVGPKLAMAVLSHLSAQQLALALATGDLATLRRVPGVGNKTAQRMILELKERMEQEDFAPSVSGDAGASAPAAFNAASEAVQALMTLGYSGSEAALAVEAVKGSGERVEELVMAALKRMDSR